MDPKEFLGVMDIDNKSYKDCKVVMLPVPYEGTVSYGKGTSKGPTAIINASKQVEIYDIELDKEAYKVGIWTEPELKAEKTPEKMVESVYNAAKKHVSAGKFIAMLGGEHSITPGLVKALSERYGNDFTVLQIDAHSDLRDELNESKNSHACAMKRARDFVPTVHIGIRSMCAEEAELIKKEKIPVFYAKDIHDNKDWFDKAINACKKNVFVSFDIDGLDPSIMPATGTPEPGGLYYWQIIAFFEALAKKRNIIGFDLVELAPQKDNNGPDFLCARMVYKMIGMFVK